jgi:hypothetical protein
MAQTIREFRQRHVLTLNTDGQRHPLENSLTVAACVLGALAVVTSAFSNLHLISSWAGLIGIITAGYGQYISVTTAERFLLILGLGASGIGFFIGMAHGGLFGGLF